MNYLQCLAYRLRHVFFLLRSFPRRWLDRNPARFLAAWLFHCRQRCFTAGSSRDDIRLDDDVLRQFCHRLLNNSFVFKLIWTHRHTGDTSHRIRWKLPSSTTPLSFEVSSPRNLAANIRTCLIFLETHRFCHWPTFLSQIIRVYLYSILLQWAPKDECSSVHIGRSRSSKVDDSGTNPTESACATSY